MNGTIDLLFRCKTSGIRLRFILDRDHQRLSILALDGFAGGNVNELEQVLEDSDIQHMDGDTFERILRADYFEYEHEWLVMERVLDLRQKETK